MIDKIKRILLSFCVINTGSLFGSFIFIEIFEHGNKISQSVYWQVSFVAFILTLVVETLLSSDAVSKRDSFVRILISYLIVNISVVGSAYLFKWITENFIVQTFALMFIILLVYLFVYVISYTNDTKVANELNKKLKEINNKN